MRCGTDEDVPRIDETKRMNPFICESCQGLKKGVFMSKSLKKNEAYKLRTLLARAGVTLYDYTDLVWNEILSKVERTDFLRRIPEYSKIPDEAPFMLGDIKGKETGLPDVIFRNENYVLGIECFEFDSSEKTKRGSQMRRDDIKAHIKLDEKLKESNLEHSKIEVLVPTKFSYKNYIDSLFEGFNSHIKNLDKYKTALKTKFPGKDILFAFFIEDTTKMGNYVRNQFETKGANPLFVKEFVNLFSQYSGIDYIITSYFDELYVQTTYIQKIDSYNIAKLIENSYTSQDEFITFSYKIQVKT